MGMTVMVMDREKIISLLKEMSDYFRECRTNASLGSKAENHFWELQIAAQDAATTLGEQEDLGEELTNAVELIQKKNERIEKLMEEQEAVFANLVVDWLREIALNNFDCNRDMTFLDAVEDIRDRASYGLKQYFIDRQKGR